VLSNIKNNDLNISLACAHPAKFPDSIEKAIGIDVEKPKNLKEILDKKEKYTVMENNFTKVQNYILEKI